MGLTWGDIKSGVKRVGTAVATGGASEVVRAAYGDSLNGTGTAPLDEDRARAIKMQEQLQFERGLARTPVEKVEGQSVQATTIDGQRVDAPTIDDTDARAIRTEQTGSYLDQVRAAASG